MTAPTTNELLQEKWGEMLDSDRVEAVDNPYRRHVTARLLENQEKFLSEAVNVTADMATFVPTVMAMVRRSAPKLIAFDVAGLQPLTQPNGRIFALRARYGTGSPLSAQDEALFNEADTSYSGTGTHAGDDPFTDPLPAGTTFETGSGKPTAAGEVDPWAQMGVNIESIDVSVTTRQLRADYSLELAQDMRAVHGLDADAELAAILANEVTAETNRELIRTIYGIARKGAQFSGTPGTFDLSADSDGRWSGERYTSLLFAMERDANQIAIDTKMGKGNLIIASANVVSALAMAGLLSYTTALQQTIDLQVDPSGPTFAGTMGRFRVFVDPYVSTDGYVVGYRGASQYDAGFFYCPYVPLQMVRGQNPVTFHPSIGYKTRYGLVSNPFTSMSAGQNIYYRKAGIRNLR